MDIALFLIGWMLIALGLAGIICLAAIALKSQRRETVFNHGEAYTND